MVSGKAIEQCVVLVGLIAAAITKELGAYLGTELGGGIAEFCFAKVFIGVEHWSQFGVLTGVFAFFTALFVFFAAVL